MSDRKYVMATSDSRSKEEQLFDACEEGREDDVRRILCEGADVNWAIQVWLGATCMYIASMKGHAAIVRVLLDAGADCELADFHGITPLMIAAAYGNDDVVDILLDAGADVNAIYNLSGTKAIHFATAYIPIMISLIRAGADVEARNLNGYVDTIAYLVDAGVDVDAKDDEGHDARRHTERAFGYVDDEMKARILAILDSVSS